MYEKKELRKRFRILRESLKREEKDKRIAEYALEAFGKEEGFFIYLSFGSEAGTEALIAELRARGKIVCAPRIEGRIMKSVPLTDKLEAGAYGILAPAEGEELTCPVIFAPMLAWDEEGYRLGYGGGYYDRYFAAHPDSYRVGLAYEGQCAECLPREETDLPLDALVTECGVRYFDGRSTERGGNGK